MFKQLKNIIYFLIILTMTFLGCNGLTEDKNLNGIKNIDTLSMTNPTTTNAVTIDTTTKELEDEYAKSMNIKTYFSHPITDTLLYFETDIPCAIFTRPTGEEIDEMKKLDGEDFYTIADDVMYYDWQSGKLLDTLNIKQFYTEKKYLKLIKQDRNVVFLNAKVIGPSWQLFFFNPGKDPIVVSSVDVTRDEIDNYFNK